METFVKVLMRPDGGAVVIRYKPHVAATSLHEYCSQYLSASTGDWVNFEPYALINPDAIVKVEG